MDDIRVSIIQNPGVTPPESVIHKILELNQDAFSTTNALVTLTIITIVVIASYYSLFIQQRTTEMKPIFSEYMTGPGLALTIAALIGSVTIFLGWNRTGHQGRVLMIGSGFFLVGALVWGFIMASNPTDEWNAPKLGLSEADGNLNPIQAVTVSIVVLVIAGFAANFYQGKLRVDRMEFTQIGFISMIALAFFSCYLFQFIFTLILRSLEAAGVGGDDDYKVFYYIGCVLLVFLTVILLDRLSAFLLSFLSTRQLEYTGTPVDSMAYRATVRTYSMFRWALILSILIPAIMVWRGEKTMQVREGSDITKDWTWVVITVLVGLIITMVFGALTLQVLNLTPTIYMLLSSVMFGFALFLVGTYGIYWSDVISYLMVALVFITVIWFFTNVDHNNQIMLGFMVAFMFVLVNTAGTAVVTAVENSRNEVLSYWPRVGLYILPLLIAFFVWFYRSRLGGTSLGPPLIFGIFSLVYVFLYDPLGFEKDYSPYIPNASRIQTLGMELLVSAALLVPIISLVKFIYIRTSELNLELTGGAAPLAEGLVQIVIYIIMGFVGAIIYRATQTNETINSFIVNGQEHAKTVYDKVVNDIQRGSDWGKLSS